MLFILLHRTPIFIIHYVFSDHINMTPAFNTVCLMSNENILVTCRNLLRYEYTYMEIDKDKLYLSNFRC